MGRIRFLGWNFEKIEHVSTRGGDSVIDCFLYLCLFESSYIDIEHPLEFNREILWIQVNEMVHFFAKRISSLWQVVSIYATNLRYLTGSVIDNNDNKIQSLYRAHKITLFYQIEVSQNQESMPPSVPSNCIAFMNYSSYSLIYYSYKSKDILSLSIYNNYQQPPYCLGEQISSRGMFLTGNGQKTSSSKQKPYYIFYFNPTCIVRKRWIAYCSQIETDPKSNATLTNFLKQSYSEDVNFQCAVKITGYRNLTSCEVKGLTFLFISSLRKSQNLRQVSVTKPIDAVLRRRPYGLRALIFQEQIYFTRSRRKPLSEKVLAIKRFQQNEDYQCLEWKREATLFAQIRYSLLDCVCHYYTLLRFYSFQPMSFFAEFLYYCLSWYLANLSQTQPEIFRSFCYFIRQNYSWTQYFVGLGLNLCIASFQLTQKGTGLSQSPLIEGKEPFSFYDLFLCESLAFVSIQHLCVQRLPFLDFQLFEFDEEIDTEPSLSGCWILLPTTRFSYSLLIKK